MNDKNALIVGQDDEAFVSLTTQGYHILEVKNSLEALRSILRITPDLIVAPVEAPLLNGLALAGLLKLLQVKVPIVFIGSNPGAEEVALLGDAVAFVEKRDIEEKLELEVTRLMILEVPCEQEFEITLRGREWMDLTSREVKKKILLIEDSTWLKGTCMASLDEQDSYQLFSAKDGMEGLAKLFILQPDLIIADLHMEELDGLVLAEILFLLNLAIPIVLLTTDLNHHLTGRKNPLGSVMGVILKQDLQNQAVFIKKVEQFLLMAAESRAVRGELYKQGDPDFLSILEETFLLKGQGLCASCREDQNSPKMPLTLKEQMGFAQYISL
ncbi:MAG: response regulator [SAR324 cluster bacterium]|nr:response regulator [SAR324 cluster bacterium]